MTFNSIISNISEWNYYDIPNIDFSFSSDNNQITLALFHVNIIEQFQKFW